MSGCFAGSTAKLSCCGGRKNSSEEISLLSANKSIMASPQVVDIATLIENWAWDHFLDMEATKGRKNEHKGIERDDCQLEINYKHLQVVHDDPDYQNFHPTNSKPFTLFKTVFTNNTGRTQSYSFKTERSTESLCLICKEQGYTIGEEIGLTLKTPCEILECNAGFKHEMNFNKATENSVTEILTWGVDSNIEVPARYQTVAELVVEEMSFSGSFTLTSRFSGRVTVSVIRRRDGVLLMPVTAQIGDIFRDGMNTKFGKDLKQFVTIDKSEVRLTTRGKCSFQFASRQKVELNEESMVKHTATQTAPSYDSIQTFSVDLISD